MEDSQHPPLSAQTLQHSPKSHPISRTPASGSFWPSCPSETDAPTSGLWTAVKAVLPPVPISRRRTAVKAVLPPVPISRRRTGVPPVLPPVPISGLWNCLPPVPQPARGCGGGAARIVHPKRGSPPAAIPNSKSKQVSPGAGSTGTTESPAIRSEPATIPNGSSSNTSKQAGATESPAIRSEPATIPNSPSAEGSSEAGSPCKAYSAAPTGSPLPTGSTSSNSPDGDAKLFLTAGARSERFLDFPRFRGSGGTPSSSPTNSLNFSFKIARACDMRLRTFL
jgi:hypothetical protein